MHIAYARPFRNTHDAIHNTDVELQILIAVVDYGMGNLRSVQKALEHVGARVSVTDDPAQVRRADKCVVPGVGSFDRAVHELKKRNLWDEILGYVRSGKPFLGICVGFQLLFESSEEGSGERGLGIFKGRVCRFSNSKSTVDSRQSTRLKVPHMGWNGVRIPRPDCPLFKQVADGSYFYFVHSYYAASADPACVSGETSYGTAFTSAVWKDHVFGTQFHPEKSQAAGLTVLKNFVDL